MSVDKCSGEDCICKELRPTHIRLHVTETEPPNGTIWPSLYVRPTPAQVYARVQLERRLMMEESQLRRRKQKGW